MRIILNIIAIIALCASGYYLYTPQPETKDFLKTVSVPSKLNVHTDVRGGVICYSHPHFNGLDCMPIKDTLYDID